jgi:hypothetical protein
MTFISGGNPDMYRFLIILMILLILILGTGCRNYSTTSSLQNVNESLFRTTERKQQSDSSAKGNGDHEYPKDANSVKLMIKIGDKRATAILNDSKPAKDFLSLLPLTLKMTDYNRIEKVAVLPRQLNLDGAPSSFDPSAGDICTYTPWGNFVVYYKDFANSTGLVPLARMVSGLEYFASQTEEFEITIEMEKP